MSGTSTAQLQCKPVPVLWVTAAAASAAPAGAIKDENGNYILDENGNYILPDVE